MVSNIERFDLTVVLVLAELYGRFPVRKALDASKFMLTDDGQIAEGLSSREEAELDFNDPYFKRKQFAFECMHWLIEAGYLHGKAHAYEYIENAVLTAKGLEVLKATPDSLQESLGERMQEAAKSGMGETARALIGQVVSLGVGLVT
ncbi:hypothetical protein [Aeromonas caviae]|uniref:hypothetical protein n=1 Tax=Aeromonas caviae TaxID=648 RepID=UPI0021C4664C|nr:hypothetical protein [Aeromonas caviae]BDO06950.1 hypothetical protein KAM643c_05230 [Aeromonas caviae]